MATNKMNTVFVLSLCLTFNGIAQTDTTKLLPATEVTAQRFNRFSVGQIQLQGDSQTVSFYKNLRLTDYLQSETPLSIKAYGTGLASVSVRGMAANHTTVLWNGINLQNPLHGLNDLAILEVGSVSRIDVKLGGCSALGGSGAIGGIVYLENEKPQNDGIHGTIGYDLGSFGLSNAHGQLDFNEKKWGGSVRLSHQAATNDFVFRNNAELGKPLQHVVHAAYNNRNATANLFGQLSDNDFVKFSFWQSRNFRELTPTMTSRNDNAVYKDTADRLTGEWTHLFNKSVFKVRGAYLYDKNFYESDVVKNSQNGVRSVIGEVEWNGNITTKHSLRAGINATSDQSNNGNYREIHERNRLAFFISDAFTTDFVTLTANLRQEWIDKWQPTTFSIGFEKNVLKSSIPNSQSPIPNPQSLILRGAFSRNYNVPTFNDLYWTQLGNPNLVTEQGWSKELGVSFKTKKDNKQLQADFTVFDIDMKNRIVWQPQSDGQWRPTNLNQVQSQGIETLVRLQVSNPTIKYRISANYQFAHATDGKGGVQLFVPAHKGSLSAWLQYKRGYAAWQQTASSKRYGATDKTMWTNPFTLADATLGYSPTVFKYKKHHFDLNADIYLRVSNVFNTDYEVVRFYPNARRQYRLAFLLRF
jgi:vitamin B12 transporter